MQHMGWDAEIKSDKLHRKRTISRNFTNFGNEPAKHILRTVKKNKKEFGVQVTNPILSVYDSLEQKKWKKIIKWNIAYG